MDPKHRKRLVLPTRNSRPPLSLPPISTKSAEAHSPVEFKSPNMMRSPSFQLFSKPVRTSTPMTSVVSLQVPPRRLKFLTPLKKTNTGEQKASALTRSSSHSTNPLPEANPSPEEDVKSKAKIKTYGSIIKWKSGELIGQGSEGEVFKALNTSTGGLIAVKKLFSFKKASSSLLEDVSREVDILQLLQHPHIVKYLASELVGKTFCIYLEFMPGGSVKSLIARLGPLSESLTQLYTLQMLQGLEYLHANKIVHRDLKSANLLIDSRGVLKVTDFGSSKLYSDKLQSGHLKTIRGSLSWTAPEVVQQIGYGRKADVWSVGCTVYEMLVGNPPWSDLDYLQLLRKLAMTNEVPDIPECLSAQAQQFLKLCFKRIPEQRASVLELLGTDFITKSTKS